MFSPLNSLNDSNLPYLLKIIRISVTNKQYGEFLCTPTILSLTLFQGILAEAFLLLSTLRSESFLSLPLASRRAPVENIRPLLSSHDPNERYLFLSCLDCVDARWWAGTTPESPAILEQHEVHRFMIMLDSSDSLIRRKVSIFSPPIVLKVISFPGCEDP